MRTCCCRCFSPFLSPMTQNLISSLTSPQCFLLCLVSLCLTHLYSVLPLLLVPLSLLLLHPALLSTSSSPFFHCVHLLHSSSNSPLPLFLPPSPPPSGLFARLCSFMLTYNLSSRVHPHCKWQHTKRVGGEHKEKKERKGTKKRGHIHRIMVEG